MKDHKALQFENKSGLPSDGVFCLVPSRDGGVWVCTANGLAHILNGKIESFGKDIPFAPQPAYAVCETSDGGLWIGGGSGAPNLTLYRGGHHPCR